MRTAPSRLPNAWVWSQRSFVTAHNVQLTLEKCQIAVLTKSHYSRAQQCAQKSTLTDVPAIRDIEARFRKGRTAGTSFESALMRPRRQLCVVVILKSKMLNEWMTSNKLIQPPVQHYRYQNKNKKCGQTLNKTVNRRRSPERTVHKSIQRANQLFEHGPLRCAPGLMAQCMDV